MYVDTYESQGPNTYMTRISGNLSTRIMNPEWKRPIIASSVREAMSTTGRSLSRDHEHAEVSGLIQGEDYENI